jgi:hypothetical protein
MNYPHLYLVVREAARKGNVSKSHIKLKDLGPDYD